MAIRVLDIKEQKGPDLYPAKHYICDKGCFGWICYEDKVYIYYRSKRTILEHWISEQNKILARNDVKDVKDFLAYVELRLGKGVIAALINDFVKLEKEAEEQATKAAASLVLSLFQLAAE